MASSARTIAYRPGYPVVGVIPQFARDPLQLFLEAHRAHGGLARLNLAGKDAYLVTGAEYVKHVLQDNYRNYIRGDSIAPAKLLMGNGVALIDGDLWLRERRLLQPAFHRQRVAGLADVIVDTVDRTTAHWDDYARRGAPLDVAAEMMRLTLSIIVRTMFSADVSAQTRALEHAFSQAQAYVLGRSRNPFAPAPWVPTPANLSFRRAKAFLDATVFGFIEQARRQPQDDLLGRLLAARDEATGEQLSDQQARDEVMTIFFAGHETTATLLAWTWYLLDREPGLDEQVQAEAASVVGARAPSAADTANLPLLGRVLNETLRLYSPAWILARESVAADVIDGYPIPAGALLLVSPYAVHHDPALWPNPERFDPERFQPAAVEARPKHWFLPFGAGPHLCIGKDFALMEALLILTRLRQRFRLRLVPGRRAVPQPETTLRPRHGLPMHLEPR